VDFTKDALYYKGAPGEYISFVWTDGLSRENLVRLRDAVETEVRDKLGIPFNTPGEGMQFEASMGQTKLPREILVTQ
jgi:anaerobic magnesium-protoporphyrin IX monomethyl ester cyclase